MSPPKVTLITSPSSTTVARGAGSASFVPSSRVSVFASTPIFRLLVGLMFRSSYLVASAPSLHFQKYPSPITFAQMRYLKILITWKLTLKANTPLYTD